MRWKIITWYPRIRANWINNLDLITKRSIKTKLKASYFALQIKYSNKHQDKRSQMRQSGKDTIK